MGRHAAADDVDDEALATEPSRPGAHRADTGPVELVAKPAAKRAPAKKPAAPRVAPAKPAPTKATAPKPGTAAPRKKGTT